MEVMLFSRPSGTCGVWPQVPGTGVPGYYPMSLRDKEAPAFVSSIRINNRRS